jgi:nitroreductase
MNTKQAITQSEIHQLLASRWSPRAFDPKQALSKQVITSLLEAARWAPSCFNDQPWRYIVCNKESNEDTWNRLFQCLAEKNKLWAINAPLLIAVCANSKFLHNDNPNRWGQYDAGAATVSLCLQATALGLQAHQMGGFDPDKVKKEFAVPDDVDCMAVVAVGHPGRTDLLHTDFQEAEKAERQRLTLKEIAFTEKWDNGFD